LLCDGNCVNVVHRKVFWLRDPWHVRLVEADGEVEGSSGIAVRGSGFGEEIYCMVNGEDVSHVTKLALTPSNSYISAPTRLGTAEEVNALGPAWVAVGERLWRPRTKGVILE